MCVHQTARKEKSRGPIQRDSDSKSSTGFHSKESRSIDDRVFDVSTLFNDVIRRRG